MRLFHYTCRDHGLPGIEVDRVVRPNRHHMLLLPKPLAWFSDLEAPVIDGLGLTREVLHCDRSEVRITVDGTLAERWTEYARRVQLSRAMRDQVEGTTGARPVHWWVSEQPLPVLSIDRIHIAIQGGA